MSGPEPAIFDDDRGKCKGGPGVYAPEAERARQASLTRRAPVSRTASTRASTSAAVVP
jgi:hypothetical protein